MLIIKFFLNWKYFRIDESSTNQINEFHIKKHNDHKSVLKNKIFHELTQTSKNEEKNKFNSHISTSNTSSILIGNKDINNSYIENSSKTTNEPDMPISNDSSKSTNDSRIENTSISQSSDSNAFKDFFGDLSNKFTGHIAFYSFLKYFVKNSIDFIQEIDSELKNPKKKALIMVGLVVLTIICCCVSLQYMLNFV